MGGGVTLVDNVPGLKLDTHGSFCHFAAPEWGDTGQSVLHGVLSAISFAVAIWSAYEQIKIAHERYKIAKAHADIAWDRWWRFESAYAPLEAAMVQELLDSAELQPDYAQARSDYTQFAEAGFGAELRWRQYSLCPDLTPLRTARALASDDGVNYAYRRAERRAIDLADRRWNRRSVLLNLGRNLSSQSAQYASLADSGLKAAGERAGEAFAGAVGWLGYAPNRLETHYPAYPQNFINSTNPGGIIGSGGLMGVADMGPGISGSMAIANA